MPLLDDAPTERRRRTPSETRALGMGATAASPARSGVPARPLDLGPTAREKRAEPWRPSADADHAAAAVAGVGADRRRSARRSARRPLSPPAPARPRARRRRLPGAVVRARRAGDGGAQAARRRRLGRRGAPTSRRRDGRRRSPTSNVAAVLDVGDGEVPYVAMEYVEGCTLAALLRDLVARDEPLPLPQAMAIVAAVCHALDAARPLVHGAVKPSNVLVGRHGAIKLADFGAPASRASAARPSSTRASRPIGAATSIASACSCTSWSTGRRLAPAAPARAMARGRRCRRRRRSGRRCRARSTRWWPRRRASARVGATRSAGDLLAALHGAARRRDAASSSVRIGRLGRARPPLVAHG